MTQIWYRFKQQGVAEYRLNTGLQTLYDISVAYGLWLNNHDIQPTSSLRCHEIGYEYKN